MKLYLNNSSVTIKKMKEFLNVGNVFKKITNFMTYLFTFDSKNLKHYLVVT